MYKEIAGAFPMLDSSLERRVASNEKKIEKTSQKLPKDIKEEDE